MSQGQGRLSSEHYERLSLNPWKCSQTDAGKDSSFPFMWNYEHQLINLPPSLVSKQENV